MRVSARQQLGLALVCVVLLGIALLSVPWFSSGDPSRSPDAESPTPRPPTASQIAQNQRTVLSPSFWFGPSGNGAKLSSLNVEAGGSSVEFRYGERCVQTDSAEDCTTKASVTNEPRSRSARWLTALPACWKPYGQAWVLDCREPFRLYTGDRVISFFWESTGNEPYSIPWRRGVEKLQRFDQDGAVVPRAARFTCRELQHLPRTHKTAIPAAIRPTDACTG